MNLPMIVSADLLPRVDSTVGFDTGSADLVVGQRGALNLDDDATGIVVRLGFAIGEVEDNVAFVDLQLGDSTIKNQDTPDACHLHHHRTISSDSLKFTPSTAFLEVTQAQGLSGFHDGIIVKHQATIVQARGKEAADILGPTPCPRSSRSNQTPRIASTSC
ncbi:hypothetical protein BV20DRAFT_737680 [Pilatotrama ljubarskyi]|nr:hypothetical protein BV20DRAFT_737680 [Pilatotrama ljubarskyi]